MSRTAQSLTAFTLAVLLASAPAAGIAAPASHSAAVETAGTRPGELIVVYDAGVGALARAQTASLAGRAVGREVRVGRGRAQLVKLDSGVTRAEAVRSFSRRPGVAWVQPNFLYERAYAPDDPAFGVQWGLANTGQVVGGVAGTLDADIDATEAWDDTTGSPDVVVAVVDGGVDYTHPDLDDNIWVNAGEIAGNGLDDDGNGYVDDVRGWDFYGRDNDPMDGDDHGTHVAGIIAAEGDNSQGVAGVAYHASIMPLRFLPPVGEGDTMLALQAIAYAVDNGADVINASWGGSWNRDPETGEDLALKYLIEESGVLFVASAGNSGGNNDGSRGFWPASSDSPYVISVGNSGNTDRKHSTSNYGRTTVDLFAPGYYIMSTAPGDLEYAYMSGTSMSAPHVSGAAALVIARNPALSARQVRRVLLENVDVKSSLSSYCASGGRLNAAKAVSAAPSAPIVADTERLAGANRYETAVEIARAARPGWTGVTDIVLASGEDRFAADPLAAAGLVWAYGDAPLLLGSFSTVPSSVRAALREIGAKNPVVDVHVVGGTSVIPDERMPQVLAELRAGGATTVDWHRVSGRTRYETAAEIARVMREERPGEVPAVALVANGAEAAHFPDALALSAVSANTGAPILLTAPASVSAETTAALAALPQPVRVIVGGGSASVSDAVVATLGAERWYGANRYATAVDVAENAIAEGWLSDESVAVAASLADSLSGASIAASGDGPVLLTQTTVLSSDTSIWLTGRSGTVWAAWILGGENSVSYATGKAIESALDWQRP